MQAQIKPPVNQITGFLREHKGIKTARAETRRLNDTVLLMYFGLQLICRTLLVPAHC